MLLDKNDLPLVAEEFMNDVHFEDVDIINSLYEAVLAYEQNPCKENKDIIVDKYNHWFEHTVNHFKGEEDKMLELNFPPYMMHKGEHDRCLETMRTIIENFEEKESVAEIKSYFENDLLQWLGNHIQTMDTVTAMFFKSGLSPCQMHQ